MHRSSEAIGAIAAALAKAQAELANPEKLMVGIIRSPNPYENNRTFKYAALASGLDIVRKSLGGHEIAIVQTTMIDREAGVICLTTVLAHSSGEWLSSEWPVCAMSDIASPRRMGAALTYARRYGLFTLVGIAGEDDLDAPDLNEGSSDDPRSPPAAAHDDSGSLSGGHSSRTTSSGSNGGRAKGRATHTARPVLPPDQSAIQRDRLLAEVRDLNTTEDAANWAHLSLPAKNTLTVEDAQAVERQFRQRVSTFAINSAQDNDPENIREQSGAAKKLPGEDGKAVLRRNGATSAVQANNPTNDPNEVGSVQRRPPAAKTVRIRDKDHRRFVSTQPCLVCGRRPADPHHLRFAQPRALGRKVSDEFTVPVCRLHHSELHNWGDESAWWQSINIDPIPIALKLWAQSRPNGALGPTPHDLMIGAERDPLSKLFDSGRRVPPLS